MCVSRSHEPSLRDEPSSRDENRDEGSIIALGGENPRTTIAEHGRDRTTDGVVRNHGIGRPGRARRGTELSGRDGARHPQLARVTATRPRKAARSRARGTQSARFRGNASSSPEKDYDGAGKLANICGSCTGETVFVGWSGVASLTRKGTMVDL